VIVLFFGDVIGKPGRSLLGRRLRPLRERFGADVVVANGENAAQGVGITPAVADELFAAGVDVLTTGNHVYRHREIYRYLDEHPRIVRPFNFLPNNPGRGVTVIDTPAGRLGVVNLSGQLFLNAARSPFEVVQDALDQLHGVRNVLVDLHAEATSEKVAMGWHLDGRVSAMIGSHTHIPTADERILPRGTAYQTDVGMTGSYDSVIGVQKDIILRRFLTSVPVRMEAAKRGVELHSTIIDVDEETGRARSIRRYAVAAQY